MDRAWVTACRGHALLPSKAGALIHAIAMEMDWLLPSRKKFLECDRIQETRSSRSNCPSKEAMIEEDKQYRRIQTNQDIISSNSAWRQTVQLPIRRLL
jgi:hypothetical protein